MSQLAMVTLVLSVAACASALVKGSSHSVPVCALSGDEPDRTACGILDSDELISECTNSIAPSRTAFHYTPEIISPHMVKTKIVHCPGLECRLESGTAYFADNPNSYFFQASGLPLLDAIKVARLFEAGHVTHRLFPKDSDVMQFLLRMRLIAVSSLADGYQLSLASCGCDATLQVHVVSNATAAFLDVQADTFEFTCY